MVHITEWMKTHQSGQLNFTLSTDFSPQFKLPVSTMCLAGWFRHYLLLNCYNHTHTIQNFRTRQYSNNTKLLGKIVHFYQNFAVLNKKTSICITDISFALLF